MVEKIKKETPRKKVSNTNSSDEDEMMMIDIKETSPEGKNTLIEQNLQLMQQ